MNEPLVFLNGQFLPASQAHLNIYDMGVVMGATFTEMARTFNGQLFRIEEHLARLNSSLQYGGIELPLSFDSIQKNIHRLVSENLRLLEDGQELALVCFVTAGENQIYAGRAHGSTPAQPTLCIHSFPIVFRNYQRFYAEGAHVVIPNVRHIPPQCIDPRTKHRSRLHWFLADKEVRAKNPHALSLLLDLDGNITESAGANFLICKDRTIFCADSRKVLGGISLQTVQEIALELDVAWIESDFSVEDVVQAEEAWLTSTPYCIAPCTRINHQNIGSGKIGPIFREILSAWSEKVGLDIEEQILQASY